jgi:hypothetical protein
MDKDKAINFLNKIDVDTTGSFEPQRYILEIDNSDDYSYYYTLLNSIEDLELVDTSSMSTEYATVLKYKDDDYTISLNANFIDDYYTFVLEEN